MPFPTRLGTTAPPAAALPAAREITRMGDAATAAAALRLDPARHLGGDTRPVTGAEGAW